MDVNIFSLVVYKSLKDALTYEVMFEKSPTDFSNKRSQIVIKIIIMRKIPH